MSEAPIIFNRRTSDHGAGDCPGGCDKTKTVEQRLNDGEGRMRRIEDKLTANCIDTAEVLDILRLGKSFFRLAGYLSNIVKWVAGIGTATLLFWYAIKDWPKH